MVMFIGWAFVRRKQKEIDPLPPQRVTARKREQSRPKCFCFPFVSFFSWSPAAKTTDIIKVYGHIMTHVCTMCTSTIQTLDSEELSYIYMPRSVKAIPFVKSRMLHTDSRLTGRKIHRYPQTCQQYFFPIMQKNPSKTKSQKQKK